LGYTVKELMQLNVGDWDAQWSAEELQVKIRELISHPAVFETKYKRKDGTFCDVQISATGVTLDGKTFLYASTRDVTESNRKNDSVKQTRLNYETFFNTIDNFLWVLDLQGNIIYCNINVFERLGYSPEELYGQSVLMVHPPERRAEAGAIVNDMLNGSAIFCPVPIMTKSGMLIPVETRVSHGSWDGMPVIFGVTKDISKVKLSEEKFSKVFYLNPSACGLSDLGNGTYLEVNDAFCVLLGFSKEEVIGKTAPELGILSDESKLAILLKQDSRGNVTNVQAELKAKNGDMKHVLVSSENIKLQDGTYRFTVVHDVTELMQAETEILKLNQTLEQRVNERTGQLEASNRELEFHLKEIEQFIYIVSHDLSEPLLTLTNVTRLIHEEYAGQLDEDGNKCIEFILNSATRMRQLLKGLLDYSLLGKESISTAVDCNKVVSEVLSELTESIQASNAGITVLKLPTVHGYLAELHHLFRNLTDNAIKFRKKDTCPEIRISAEGFETEWLFAIEDNGSGIYEHNRDKVFNLFKRLVNRNEFEGTGIGLAQCKKIVELHGGRIWVESNSTGGSTFRFTIPK
jgi:PAS domain S-box-containing protein